MRDLLPRPEYVPVNRVHAMDLQQALSQEYSKQAWREASAAALKRWADEGNKPERVTNNRRSSYVYTEEE